MPSKVQKAVVDYLERYGQPQSLAAINDHLTSIGHDALDHGALAEMVADKSIAYADGGIDDRGQEVNLYAPLGYRA